MARRRKKREKTRRFRPMRWLIILGIATVLFVAFLPTIISSTPLKQSVIRWGSSDFKGEVKVESLSLAWWAPVSASGITLIDESGETLIQIEHLKTKNSLMSLATSSNLGQLDAENIELNLDMRGDTTNMEQALENYINAPSTGAPLTKVQLNWKNAKANITAQGYQAQWQLTESEGNVVVGDTDSPLKLTVNGFLKSNQSTPRPIQVNASFAGDASAIDFAQGIIELSGDQVEMSIATPVFDRLETPLDMAGYFQGKAMIVWSDWGGKLSFSTEKANLQNLAVQSDYYLGADTINLEQATISGSFQMAPEGWLAKDLNAETNVGKLSANGLLNIERFVAALSTGKLPTEEIRATGELDFAKLAKMLPGTLRLHSDVTIENAIINFQLSNWTEDNDRLAILHFETPRLEATRGGQPFTWNNPVRLSASARESNAEVAIEKLVCTTDFLKIEGDGTLQRAAFSVEGDLEKMTKQLSQLFDLGGMQFAGIVDGRLGWDRTQAQSLYDPFRVGATLNVTNPMVQTKTTRWMQPQLSLEAVAETQIDAGKNILVSQGSLSVIAGQDRLDAKLIEPVANASVNSTIPLEIVVSGGLESWLAQASPFVSLEGISASGSLNTKTLAYVSMQQVALRDMETSLSDVSADVHGVRIREPKVTLAGNMDVNMQTGGFLLDDASFVSSTVSASGHSIQYQPENAGGLGGSIAFRANLNRLSKWFPQLDSSEVHWFGEATGNAELKYNGNVVAGVIETEVKDLVAATPQKPGQPGTTTVSNPNGWQVLWREDIAKLNSTLAITPDLNNLRLDQLTLESAAVKLSAQGEMSDLLSTINMKLNGTWTPDFDKINGLVAAYAGDKVSVSGGQAQSFRIQGPLFSESAQSQGNAWIPNQLRAETELAWQQINLYGLSIGPAAATASLANSAAIVQTASMPISGGSIQIAPTVHFRGDAPTIVLPEGVIAQQVQLTEDNCRGWLKFVAPFVADATDAQGSFSVSTKGIRLPLANTNAAKGEVDVTIHGAQVGPGPLGEQIIGIANQVKSIIEGPNAGSVANQNGTWLQMPQQNIPVEIKGGRIHHQNVTFQTGSMTIQTTGSVGMDQSINMVAEVPILDQWIAGRPYLSGLQGKKIGIPISGTLTKPKLDSRILQTLAKDLLQATAQGAVQNELNGLIQNEGQKIQDKLFNGILNPGGNGANNPGGQQSGGENLLNGAINQGLNKFFGPKKQ